jgi:hypothetical protein
MPRRPLSVASENWEHALLLVGYDDLNTICTQKYGKSGCWILKNSWGVFSGFSHDVWHDYGYAYIPYSGFKYSDIKNGAYYVIPSDYALHADFEMMDGLAAGDLDGDGISEIVHADRGDLLQIFNRGGLQSSEQMDFEEGDRIAVGDVDGDGRMDVIHADRGNEVIIHFRPPVGVVSSFYLDFEEGDDIAAGDVNGDGMDEIVHADRGDWVRVYSMHGVLLGKMRFNFEFGDGFAVADFNGDGKDDIIHGDRGDSFHIVKGERWFE